MTGTAAVAAFTPGEKEAIRLWYEYLQLARKIADPLVIAALQGSIDFYAPWQVENHPHFNDWWKQKKSLFADTSVVRILAPEDPPDEGSVVIQVPLNKSLTGLLADIRAVLGTECERRHRTGRKSKRSRTASYTLTNGAEPRLVALREMLTCYGVFLAHNPRLKGEDLLMAAHSHYLKRKSERWRKVPTALLYDPANPEDKARAMRNLRRYIQSAEKIVLNVARGQFPGDY